MDPPLESGEKDLYRLLNLSARRQYKSDTAILTSSSIPSQGRRPRMPRVATPFTPPSVAILPTYRTCLHFGARTFNAAVGYHCRICGSHGNSVHAQDPCANVNCGAHGSCNAGTCTCRDGYTGSNCQNAPVPRYSLCCWNYLLVLVLMLLGIGGALELQRTTLSCNASSSNKHR